MNREKQFMIREESLLVQLDEARKTAAYFAAENEMLRQKMAELLDREVERNRSNEESEKLNDERKDANE